MGVRNTATENVAAMFCSTDGRAFGPTFDSGAELDDFLEWAAEHEDNDLRTLSEHDLNAIIMQWRAARARTDANN